MFKQMSIIILGMVLFATLTDSKPFNRRSEGHPMVQARHVDNEKFRLRELFGFYQFLKRFDGTISDDLRTFNQQLLDAHNADRKTHCANPLQLDDSLIGSAQTYAETLAAADQMVHSHTPGLGEIYIYQ
jgi:uncharacterized protein YkwD